MKTKGKLGKHSIVLFIKTVSSSVTASKRKGSPKGYFSF